MFQLFLKIYQGLHQNAEITLNAHHIPPASTDNVSTHVLLPIHVPQMLSAEFKIMNLFVVVQMGTLETHGFLVQSVSFIDNLCSKILLLYRLSFML